MNAKKTPNGPRRTLLPNGIWVGTEFLPHVRSASLGVYLDTGSRDEMPEAAGLSHFFEHMVFKGTPRLNPLDIVSRFESTGGQVNAWTSKEQTCFYGKVTDAEAGVAQDTLLEMVFDGKFAPADVRKEKDVVIEEIRSVNDSPDELAHEMFSLAAFGTHSAGRAIAGTEKSVRGLTVAQLRAHRDAARTKTPAAIVAVGKVDHDEVVARARKYFGIRGSASKSTTGRPRIDRQAAAFRARHQAKGRDVQQATVVIGGEACSWMSPDRYPLLLLHCVLGDGMSSRLFQNIRETHGIVYSIYTVPEFLSREGTFGVGLATDPGKVEKAIKEIGRELARVRKEGLPKTDLLRAKENVKGSLLLGMESTGSRMSTLSRRLLGAGWEETTERILARIDAVTPADVSRCAARYLNPSSWASAVVAPKDYKSNLAALLAKA
ncbi:MAG TPA: pitrilysin family protein [Fibrobacteria bacterium]|nr:pitrilysin family protein [Fibrobacteria bacterium]